MSNTTDRAIECLLRLRRAERVAGSPVREDIAPVREFLEELLGPTVRPAHAARLLGISQPALSRWLDQGDVASVVTPEGRREIPLSELLDLVEDVVEVRDAGAQRPVARVIHDRQRRALETIDLDRIFPDRKRSHRSAELQSLAYHRVVADRLDDQLVERARRRLDRWREAGQIHPRWADEWGDVLSKSLSEIGGVISADSAHARSLRQTSPFAGALNEQERRRLVRFVEGRT